MEYQYRLLINDIEVACMDVGLFGLELLHFSCFQGTEDKGSIKIQLDIYNGNTCRNF